MSLLPLAIRQGSDIDFTLYQKWTIMHSVLVYLRAGILPPLTSKMGLKINVTLDSRTALSGKKYGELHMQC